MASMLKAFTLSIIIIAANRLLSKSSKAVSIENMSISQMKEFHKKHKKRLFASIIFQISLIFVLVRFMQLTMADILLSILFMIPIGCIDYKLFEKRDG